MAKQLLRPALLLVLSIALMARSASAAPLIDVFDTFGVGHSYNPGAFYLVEEGVRQIAVPFAVSQPLTIAQIDVAAVGTGIQVRIASNGPGNLPGIPFFGGLGFDANGFFSFSPCLSCGTLPSAGTYWFIMTGSFGFRSEIHWFENDMNLIGTLAVDTVVDSNGLFDPSGWQTITGELLPAIAIYGTTPVPEPGTWVLFATGLIAILTFARRRRQYASTRGSAIRYASNMFRRA